MVTVLGGMEPESAQMCLYMLTAITVEKPLVWTFSFIPAYGMRAAGDVKYSMIVSCISMWMLRVALCVYLCRVQGFGPIAVWIGMFTGTGLPVELPFYGGSTAGNGCDIM